jgi:hypothetical protein
LHCIVFAEMVALASRLSNCAASLAITTRRAVFRRRGAVFRVAMFRLKNVVVQFSVGQSSGYQNVSR